MNLKATRKGLAAAVVGMALGMGAMVNTASADPISYAGAYTYIADLNPTLGQDAGFAHTPLADGAFSDWWVFSVNPKGDASINAAFIPQNDISGFSVSLYAVTSGTCTVPGATCTGVTYNPVSLATSTNPSPQFTGFDFITLAAGNYAFNVTGIVDDTSVAIDRYSGNITTQPVPEPATLALLGAGLLVSSRLAKRRQKKEAEAAAA